MKTMILGAAIAAATLAAGAAMAQPYGYGGYSTYSSGYNSYAQAYAYGGYAQRAYVRDSDRDGVPDRAEWNRDRDRDGRPDQWDRYDNRRDRHHHRRHDRRDSDRYEYRHDRGYGYGW